MTRRIYLTIITCITVLCILIGTITHAIGLAVRAGNWGNDGSEAETDEDGEMTKNYDIGSFDILILNIEMGNVVIRDGSSYEMSWTGAANRAPVMEIKDGTLTVTQKGNWHLINNPLSGKNVLTITIPQNTIIRRLEADLAMGNCKISDVSARDAKLDLDAGNLELFSGAFDTLNIDADMGNVTVTDCSFSKGDFDADMGNITIEHADEFNKLNLDADLGNIEVSTALDVNAMTLDLDTDLGNITINGKKVSGSLKQGAGSARLEARANMGNIRIIAK